MRKTIEDLTEEKTFYHRDRDAFGNRTKEPYQKAVKRPVQLVTGWKRFGHYILDALILGLINFVVDQVWLAVLNTQDPFTLYENRAMLTIIPSLDNMVILVMYYFLCENYLQRTIGKYATNCVVINQYAEKPKADALFGRSAARLVPFEAFSCLGDRGWHDTWSKTYVVTVEERDRLRKLLNEQEGFFVSESSDLLD
ncbi:MAG: RDD family protein [Fluviicola sp.]|jgi:uncharacterized RDD family membrane protein YckC